MLAASCLTIAQRQPHPPRVFYMYENRRYMHIYINTNTCIASQSVRRQLPQAHEHTYTHHRVSGVEQQLTCTYTHIQIHTYTHHRVSGVEQRQLTPARMFYQYSKSGSRAQHESFNLVHIDRRSKRNPWTETEIQALKDGVEKYGKVWVAVRRAPEFRDKFRDLVSERGRGVMCCVVWYYVHFTYTWYEFRCDVSKRTCIVRY
jgi:hypothetical protein